MKLQVRVCEYASPSVLTSTTTAVVEILDKNQAVAPFLEGAVRDGEKAKSLLSRAILAALDTAARRN